jgi:hypothetical protein
MQLVFLIASAVAPSVLGMKLVFVLFDLGVLAALLWLLLRIGVSPLRVIVYAWSPLVIVEFAGSGHNDALPILGVVLALLCLTYDRPRLTIAALSASALSKLYACFLLPLFLLRTSWKLLWIPIVLGISAFLPYREGAARWWGILAQYNDRWRNNESLFLVLRTLIPEPWQGTAYLLAVAAVIVYCGLRKLSPERSVFLVTCALLLLSPNVFPWYLTWLVPLLAIHPSPAWLLLTVTVFLSYHVLIPYGVLGLWREDPVFIALEYAPFYALLLGFALRPKKSSSLQS